jgi:hypothetical protein
MTCEQFIPIGPDGYGFCNEHNRHVSTPAYQAAVPLPKVRCLCDYCKPGADGRHVIDPDVFFYMHDFPGLKSVEKELFEKMVAEAAGMKCAVRAPRTPPQEAKKMVKPAPKPKKVQPRLF